MDPEIIEKYHTYYTCLNTHSYTLLLPGLYRSGDYREVPGHAQRPHPVCCHGGPLHAQPRLHGTLRAFHGTLTWCIDMVHTIVHYTVHCMVHSIGPLHVQPWLHGAPREVCRPRAI